MPEKSPRSPYRYGHRVQKARSVSVLPRGVYRAGTFIDTDGTEYEVASGALEGPPWPEGTSEASDIAVPARIHLPRVR